MYKHTSPPCFHYLFLGVVYYGGKLINDIKFTILTIFSVYFSDIKYIQIVVQPSPTPELFHPPKQTLYH